jgi:hypothetical protein
MLTQYPEADTPARHFTTSSHRATHQGKLAATGLFPAHFLVYLTYGNLTVLSGEFV